MRHDAAAVYCEIHVGDHGQNHESPYRLERGHTHGWRIESIRNRYPHGCLRRVEIGEGFGGPSFRLIHRETSGKRDDKSVGFARQVFLCMEKADLKKIEERFTRDIFIYHEYG